MSSRVCLYQMYKTTVINEFEYDFRFSESPASSLE